MKSLKERYYYDVVHWQIKHYIFQVRAESYPQNYWKAQLQNSLITRNTLALQLCHKVWQPGLQLSLFS